MNWEVFSWMLTALSLSGNIFIIKKSVVGQWMWAIANVGWIVFNISKGLYAPAFLFTVYLGMCIWGIFAWSKSAAKDAAPAA